MGAARPQGQSLVPHTHGGGGSGGPRSDRVWHCPKCRITNFLEQRDCSQCGISAQQGLPVALAKVAVGRVSTGHNILAMRSVALPVQASRPRRSCPSPSPRSPSAG